MNRHLLKEDQSYHIDPSRPLGGDGLTEETAFSSLPEAYAHLQENVSLGGRKVTFLLADGVYSQGLTVGPGAIGGGEIHVCGKNEGGAKIEVADGGGVVNTSSINPVAVKNIWLPSCSAYYAAQIIVQSGVSFTDSYRVDKKTGERKKADHMSATYLGLIFVKDPYAIRGRCDTHIHAYTGGIITIDDNTQIWPDGVSDMTRFIGVADGSVVARNIYVHGNFDCHTYLVHKNGFADLESAHLPGTGRIVQTGGVVT
jgi:hypothetical protein